MKRFFYALLFIGTLAGIVIYFWPSTLNTLPSLPFISSQIEQKLFSSSSIPVRATSFSRSLGKSLNSIREKIASGTKDSSKLYQSVTDKINDLPENARVKTIAILGGTSTLPSNSLSVDICISIKPDQTIKYLIQIPSSPLADYEIDWGDKNITKGKIVSQESEISVSHSYKISGIYQSIFKLPSTSGSAISKNKICVE